MGFGAGPQFLVCALVLAPLGLFLLSPLIPYNMDEFLAYHALACKAHPLNALNVFRQSCHGLDLAPPIAFDAAKDYLPLRTYRYVGSAHALLYYPLYRLWPSPLSARLLGLLMLAAQAWLIGILFKRSVVLAFAALMLFMPYAYQHLVDTGQLSFQTTSVFLYARLLHQSTGRLRQGSARACLGAVLMGALLSFGLFLRLSYVFLLPALLLWTAAALLGRSAPAPGRRTLTVLWLGLFLCAWLAPSLFLLLSTDRGGIPYLAAITRNAPFEGWAAFVRIWRHFTQDLLGYLTNPLSTAHIEFNAPTAPSAVGIAAAAAFGLLLLIGVCRRDNPKRRAALLYLGLGALTLAAISASPDAWAMHHVVLAGPFFILAACAALARGSSAAASTAQRALLAAVLVLNAVHYRALAGLEPGAYFDNRAGAVNDLVNRFFAKRTLVVVIDWNMYYLKALYGPPEQAVLYAEPLNREETVNAIAARARQIGRSLLFIARHPSASDLSLLRRRLRRFRRVPVSDIGAWELWQAEAG